MENDIIWQKLKEIETEDPEAFSDFGELHSICFKKEGENYLFPMMYNYYVEKVRNPKIMAILQEIGLKLHECKF